jgi:hypothetical protein
MKIYGVSQSTGVERLLKIERGIDGIVLTVIEHVGQKERGRIIVLADPLLAAIMEPPAGGATIAGLPQANAGAMALHIEVKRNEVLLRVDAVADGSSADVAVGLDDLQDALEGVISRG